MEMLMLVARRIRVRRIVIRLAKSRMGLSPTILMIPLTSTYLFMLATLTHV